MKRLLVTLLLAPSAALAQADAGIRYTWFEVGHTMSVIDAPGDDVDASGWNFNASFAVRKFIHLYAEYETVELDDFAQVTGNEKTFGIGAHFDVDERLGLFGRVGYIDIMAENGALSAADDGIRATAGARIMLLPGIELRGGVDYVDLDLAGDDTATFAGADIWLAEGIALTGKIELSEDAESYLVGGRFYFGE